MSKKKHQGDPSSGVAATSDRSDCSSDEYNHGNGRGGSGVQCSHAHRAVDLGKIKKALQKDGGLRSDCDDCKKNPPVSLSGTATEETVVATSEAATTSLLPQDMPDLESVIFEIDESLWMCLKCGHQSCGRYKNSHALQHFQTPRSDCHSICLNTTKWSIWCYDCDEELNITVTKKMLECVEYLKKQSEGGKKKNNNNLNNSDSNKDVDNTGASSKVICVIDEKTSLASSSSSFVKDEVQIPGVGDLPKARGLSNLGNTCFFNSVMQCLGQTPYLLNLLEETSKPGQYFKLPGGKLTLDEKTNESVELDPLDGELEEWKPLTKVLAETLRELQSGRPEVHNPRMLLSRLTQRMPQFGGGDQHDSHELLRHLLEAVREEDLRRYQSVILQKYGLVKADPATVKGNTKKIIKYYGSQASELLLPTEQVFRGVLVSTLQCQDCNHTSHRDEFFLDLSLPISEKQTPPVLRRKADELDDNKTSKHQIKKEKRQAKKNKKSKHHQKQIAVASASTAADNQTNSASSPSIDKYCSDSESDADVEDNIEDSNNGRSMDEGPSKGTESGYNSDKNGISPDNASPDMIVGMLSVSPLGNASPDNSAASSETNIDMGSPTCGRNTPNEMDDELTRPASLLFNTKNKSNDLKADLEKLSLKNELKTEDGACGGVGLNDEDEDEDEEDEDDDEDEEDDEKMEVDDEDMWCGTISDRYHIEDGECSVQSCLNQFTTSELMTANNKVGCELCTKRHGGPDKKTVYTNARKQLLIYNPPAVLILHLKRFQVYHFRPLKMSKNVKFPIVLDIAPFCSKRSKNLPTFTAGQNRVLYSLYGVVEHSGTMHGGHYVAYVKVRPKLDDDSYRWGFLPKNQRRDKGGAVGSGSSPPPSEPQAPPGKWYYVSDSFSSEVAESKVLNANAYLLFYERIL
ncbi:PREDICTED: ubiquitin carboxyl-terminal hydrolase 16 [Nicrophorus vespilloides]|uniref:Ubiquitin carboxyl-terminal hydrolase n=1 Tax=Nicrophorus vespilloides TaxID=110193 RepID=A0ABM1M8K8_NICVS|nr:PREDICTED: ubiquitin carboxyl-terminal hydrolase 16 [Nicrophorus vespilloides]XP_017770909.1 PREDICTED: ubiquitin carboxyl-terminal hydrolase 16 [Nicrophorus vespilloides]